MDTPDPASVDDLFFDALDSFEDQVLNDDEEEALDTSELIKTLDDSESQSNFNPNPSLDAPPPPPPFCASLRHRRLRDRRVARIPVPDDPPQPSTASTITLADSTLGQTTTATPNSLSSSLLVSIAGFVIRSILFQFNLILSFSLFPLKFACDPCGVVSAAINAVKERLLWVWNGFWGRMGLGKWAVRVCLGCFWSVYVGVVLVGILVVAFVGSGLVMRWIVEQPLRTVKELNFDYTKPSPDAVVEVRGGGGVDCVGLVGEHVGGKQVRAGSQRLELVVSLTLPESDYNRKLGMFQVYH